MTTDMRCRHCGRFVDPVTGLCDVGCTRCGEQYWLPAPDGILDDKDLADKPEPLLPGFMELV